MIVIGECLSSLTQKKGDLTEQDKQAILKYGSAWGCDICQEVCPYTTAAISRGTIYTSIEFFKSDMIPYLTSNDVESMDDNTFKNRAYSWRGRAPIIRNLKILEEKSKSN